MGVHALEVGLKQHAAPGVEEPAQVREHLCDGGARVAARVARAGTHGRLHHELRGRMAREKLLERRGGVRAGLHEAAGHHRQAGTCELEQVVLVGVPAHHGRRIQQHGERFLEALGVVPGGAQQCRIEARPIDLRLVPVDDLGVGACGAERRQQRGHVIVETARGARAHQGNRRPHSLIPAPRFISATATANSAAAAAAISVKAMPILTSDTPRKPKRNAFTMCRMGLM